MDFTVRVMFLQVTAALSMPSPWAQPKMVTVHLGLRGSCPQSWASAGTDGVGQEVEGNLLPTEEFPPSLSLTHGYAVLPPSSFSSLSLARHPPWASRSSPAAIHPAITLNSSLAFWESACFPSLLYPTSLVGYFHSGFFCNVSFSLWAY